MEKQPLYLQIADTIRQQILEGELKTGDRLPAVREMTTRWKCTTGTVQHAYQLLAAGGLVAGRAGQGTRVIGQPGNPASALRRAALIHKAESFLLEVLTEGYPVTDVEDAVRQALDRWRAVAQRSIPSGGQALRFQGSHDLVMTWLASHFEEIAPGHILQLRFSGSLGGLMALAEGKADLAGCHLWDEESNTYNLPFVRRVLPNQRVALIAVASRHIGLILPPGNPQGVQSLGDLTRAGVRFVNRQAGSGTRVWLDAQLHQMGIDSTLISGYTNEKSTHSDLARAIAEGQANAGLGLEAAADFYGLDFISLTQERYDLVCLQPTLEHPAMQALVSWLGSEAARRLIASLAGYQANHCGEITTI
ncbi:MAG TPA: substrate-binding domain-containing protein [Anaerolineaceae bacterium]|nr:substrate-binding domain-containing protein [Anaerolineaceae bacterium]